MPKGAEKIINEFHRPGGDNEKPGVPALGEETLTPGYQRPVEGVWNSHKALLAIFGPISILYPRLQSCEREGAHSLHCDWALCWLGPLPL